MPLVTTLIITLITTLISILFTTLIHINGTQNIDMGQNVDEEALTPLQLKWNSYLSIANMIPNLGMLLLNATLGHKIPMRPRLVLSLIGIIVLFVDINLVL